MDGIARKIIHRRPQKSTAFALPIVRNQQVVGSSPTAGSRNRQKTTNIEGRDMETWERPSDGSIPQAAQAPIDSGPAPRTTKSASASSLNRREGLKGVATAGEEAAAP